MTRLCSNSHVVRETGTLIRHRSLVIELQEFMLRFRLKGARWACEVDYESIFQLGAKKAAEKARADRSSGNRRRWAR